MLFRSRQDAIGTPFCVTVDHQTSEDGTVTLRYRDTMEQTRIAIDQLKAVVSKEVSFAALLKTLL